LQKESHLRLKNVGLIFIAVNMPGHLLSRRSFQNNEARDSFKKRFDISANQSADGVKRNLAVPPSQIFLVQNLGASIEEQEITVTKLTVIPLVPGKRPNLLKTGFLQ